MIRARSPPRRLGRYRQTVDHPAERRHLVEENPRSDAEAGVVDVVVPYSRIGTVIRRAARRPAPAGGRRAIGRQYGAHDDVARLVVVHAAAHHEVAGNEELPMPERAVTMG